MEQAPLAPKSTAWANLGREPYRPLFPLAMGLGLVMTAAWALALLGPGPTMGPSTHGLLFTWGFLGTAVLGFLFTAYARQNDAAQPRLPVVLAACLLQVVFVLLGLLGQGAAASAVGTLVWGCTLLWALRVAVPSLRRGFDATTAGAPLALAGATAGVACWSLAPRLAADLGVLGFLVPLALLLLDRVLPFFSRKRFPTFGGGRKPYFLPALGLGLAARIALAGQPLLAGAADLVVAATLARQWWGWRPDQTWREPMIGVLHLGLAWLLLGFVLDGILSLGGGLPGLMTRHLWTLGGMTTLLMGIAIRVVRGHGGQGLRLGADGALALGLVQLAAVLRALLPLAGVQEPALIYGASATALGLALFTWLVRLGPLVVRG